MRMRNRWRSWLVVTLAVVAAGFLAVPGWTGPAGGAERPRLAVIVVFDQMRGDYLVKWQELFGQGGFRRLQEEGAWFRNCHYPYAFTWTAAGHTSLSTGCSPDRHGVIGNEWYDRGRGEIVSAVRNDRYEQVPAPGGKNKGGAAPTFRLEPTLGDVILHVTDGNGKVVSISIKDRSAILLAALRAQAVYWLDSKSGDFVTSTYYRDRLHPWIAEFNRDRPTDRWFGKDWTLFRPDLDYVKFSGPDDAEGEGVGYKQGRAFPHPMTGGLEKAGRNYYDALTCSPMGNELLLELAKRAIDAERLGQRDTADLLCLSFSSNDLIGHVWGPDSQEVLDVTLRSDLIVKGLLDHLDAKVGKGKYVLAVSADHGICPIPEVAVTKGLKAGRVPANLLSSRASGYLQQTFGNDRPGAAWVEKVVDGWIYLNRGVIQAHGQEPTRVERALADWLMKQEGIDKVYTRSELRDMAAKGDPLREQVRKSFYADRSGDVGVVLRPYWLMESKYRTGTTHGSPHLYDTHVPLLFYGPGIRSGVFEERVTPQALPVVLARTLGIRAPAGAAVPLPKSLK
jgi:predicted AlkP superfamily pyrophosphatase or phosphodiesterase